jgi:Ulp1 protease family, C-terminal catalytic domain
MLLRRSYPMLSPQILLEIHTFYSACEYTCSSGFIHDYLVSVKKDIHGMLEKLESICFPLCNGAHWYMIVVSFKDREVRFPEGYGASPSDEVGHIIIRVLSEHLGVNTPGWNKKLRRLDSPVQRDGDSCAILALANIESFCTGESVDYHHGNVDALRIKWLRRCVDHHRTAVLNSQRLQQRSSTAQALTKNNAKTKCNVSTFNLIHG